MGYAGIEVVVWNFARIASMRGNEVTLITTNDSPNIGNFDVLKEGTNEKLGVLSVVGAGPTGWTFNDEKFMWDGYHQWLEKEFGQGQGVVWDNSWWGFPYLSQRQYPDMKIIHSHHGMSNWLVPTVNGPAYVKPPVPFPRMLGVSTHHASHISSNFSVPVRYVHNGVDLPAYVPEECQPDDYLLSLNRITPEKGIHNNIDAALQTGWQLKVVGDDVHPPNQDYINDIQNRCASSGGQIQYYGRVDNETKWDLLKHCRALIACTDNQRFLEAFGLYAVEANSVGKPVLATTNGGLFDIIIRSNDGWENGFLAPNTAGVVQAIQNGIINTFKPEVCRAHAERFTVDKMVDTYLNLFEKVLRDDSDSRW
jgi:glycosyltransferase involved in cell wall biosynthesis